MNQEIYNKTRSMFMERMADNFWANGQWKFRKYLRKDCNFDEKIATKLGLAMRGCIKRNTLPTKEILQFLGGYFTELELDDLEKARAYRDQTLLEEKRQHMKVSGTVQTAKKRQEPAVNISQGFIISLHDKDAEFVKTTENGNYIFKEVVSYKTHLLTELEVKNLLKDKEK